MNEKQHMETVFPNSQVLSDLSYNRLFALWQVSLTWFKTQKFVIWQTVRFVIQQFMCPLTDNLSFGKFLRPDLSLETVSYSMNKYSIKIPVHVYYMYLNHLHASQHTVCQSRYWKPISCCAQLCILLRQESVMSMHTPMLIQGPALKLLVTFKNHYVFL